MKFDITKSVIIVSINFLVSTESDRSNNSVANFTIAVNRRFKTDGQPTADFIPIVVWNKTAEFCDKYFQKGQQVGIVGRIQTRTWEDTEGKKHYITEVVGEETYFADSKKEALQSKAKVVGEDNINF